jgi:hypothetical protein
MSPLNARLIVGFAAVVAGTVAVVALVRHSARSSDAHGGPPGTVVRAIAVEPRTPAPATAPAARSGAAPPSEEPTTSVADTPEDAFEVATATTPVAVITPGVRSDPGPPERPVDEAGPIVPVPVAREALVFVGADPEAEAVWFAAINDPTMSAHDRSDLIEDLNEEGFADPQHLTEDDLPLIARRLALIEEVAADAMDDTNAAAFAEAYKDLLNMYARLVEPPAQ